MEVFEHEHPLSLIDLELEYSKIQEDYEDEDETDGDMIATEDLKCTCDRCGQEINGHHRYYYKCSDSCEYSIHKFCGDLPTTLKHTSHNDHILTLLQRKINWHCHACGKQHKPQEISYQCPQCEFDVDISCALTADKKTIHHPSHKHPLLQITIPIICECSACGKKHQGIFYHCITCSNFFIHTDCFLLPKKLLIQHATHDDFSHKHSLAIAYSFPAAVQEAKFDPRCRVCGGFFDNENLWIYKCDKCRYYAHLDCATARGEPFLSIFSPAGFGKTHKNFADADYPDLLYFPFPDQTYSILKHMFFKKMASPMNTIQHLSHEHPLILVGTQGNEIAKSASSKSKPLSCHNPMKKIELLCNGCLRPITNMPFYKCVDEDESCDFVLHEWCTRLPDQVPNHPGHPQHSLFLLPYLVHRLLGVFRCVVCRLYCNGFVYICPICEYYIDVNCAFIPDKIVHQAHPNHLIWRVQSRTSENRCRSCVRDFDENGFSFSCGTCEFDLHPECALLLPETIRHKFDKHPMKLSYFPIENHKSQYFCEVCEVEFDPEYWFYHCYDCVQSIHSACAPLILECRRAARVERVPKRIYEFLNIKFGGIHIIDDHPHSVSFVQGIESEDECEDCGFSLQYTMIFKCLRCDYAIHFTCCESFNKSLYDDL
ncbi:uncharacterized protein LOC112529051 [Cynara cardunculus var. scolymus]|uniref:uncharacterized protein LOC112529051 n=1 Tax=Cynara cardunculus var. scolymus TaxID=59895 RepID=UPI000D625BCE|nr:uncharacterized protein LOC112529051 [Cynara cardunculus var. scolymus]